MSKKGIFNATRQADFGSNNVRRAALRCGMLQRTTIALVTLPGKFFANRKFGFRRELFGGFGIFFGPGSRD